MAIRIRRGNQIDFDKNKLVSGELAVVLDHGELHFCYGNGNVKRLQTREDLEAILNSSPEAYAALQQLIVDLDGNPEITNILHNISALQMDKLDYDGDSKYNTTTFTEALTDEDIVSGETHSTIFGKILKSINTIKYNIGVLASEKIDKTSIVQTDTISDPAKVPSTVVTEAHGREIYTINNNLAQYTMPLTVVSNQAELDNILSDSSIPINTWYRKIFRVSASGLTLGGGSWHVEGMTAHAPGYGWQRATTYSDTGAMVQVRSKVAGAWNNWVSK